MSGNSREHCSTVLREHAEAIWRAGVAAVDSERLVRKALSREDKWLTIAGHRVDLTRLGRLVVVGAGKAGAGMAAGFESAVGDDLLRDHVSGLVNVPENCVRQLKRIRLHGARPAEVNEPTEAGVEGSRRILEMVRSLGAEDVCVVLISGGGSALLPAPAEGITLADKQAVTRHLMSAGATIHELNCVRKQLSQVKGGRLAAATRAGLVVTLIISDVIGDPLDVIASGPTEIDHSTAQDALAVLAKFERPGQPIPDGVVNLLRRAAATPGPPVTISSLTFNHVLGSNTVALEAAAEQAHRLGYAVHSLGSQNAGEACEVGRQLASLCVSIRDRSEPVAPPACVLSGGEPVVRLAKTDRPRKGGRNQELVLAALRVLGGDDGDPCGLDRIVVLSGGTDGEDGPTDAAGGVVDADVAGRARSQRLDLADALAINNSYPFLDAVGGLLRTGPTDTNVMDLRVALVGR